MICYICDSKLEQEMILTATDDLTLGFYTVVIKSVQFGVCSSCYKDWDRILQLLLIRFKENKKIDGGICKKIMEME